MRQHTAPPPAFWTLFVCRYLGASERLARHLWPPYVQACPLTDRWQLERCSRVPSMAAMAEVARSTLTPKALLVALERQYPPGPRRPREVIVLEERILRVTNPRGVMWLYFLLLCR